MNIKVEVTNTEKKKMLKVLEEVKEPKPMGTLQNLIAYEAICSVREKIRKSIHTDTLTLSLTETKAFIYFLKAFATLGEQEAIISLTLRQQIEYKLTRKYLMYEF